MRTVRRLKRRVALASATCSAVIGLFGCAEKDDTPRESTAAASAELGHAGHEDALEQAVKFRLRTGKQIFRYETFGDEEFWGDKLKLHLAIAGQRNGGVGAGISPKAALDLGLKVDVDALPEPLKHDLKRGRVDLNNPATTLALLKLNAVIGLTGFFDRAGRIERVGIQCALCHSTVDNSLATGIGHRRDGWPSRDLDIGAIVAAAPDLSAFTSLLGVSDDTLRSVLRGWGRGKFDAFVLFDGKATRPDGGSAAVLIPPLFGLEGAGLVSWNGWSGIGSWVPLVITLEMHGKGAFSDRRLADAAQFPIAAANHFDRIRDTPDRTTPKLAPLLSYVQALEPPTPEPGSYDEDAAVRGEALFTGKARCSGCHVPPLNSTPGWNIVPPATIGVDSFQADRSPNHGYRIPVLRGIQTRTRGGFFHDGRFATLGDVVAHFNTQFSLALTAAEQADLVEFLKSL